MEKRDLYDVNRNLTGETIFKGETIPANRYIIVVQAIIQNSKGEFLIQKRSSQKGGKYGSPSGHAKSGENSIQAVISEIHEEIGLNVDKNELELIHSDIATFKQVFFDVYYLKKDIDITKLVLQEEEVHLVEWTSLDRIKQLFNDGLFLEHHAKEIFRMIYSFKK